MPSSGKMNGNSTKEDMDAYKAPGKLIVNGWLLDKDQREKHAGGGGGAIKKAFSVICPSFTGSINQWKNRSALEDCPSRKYGAEIIRCKKDERKGNKKERSGEREETKLTRIRLPSYIHHL